MLMPWMEIETNLKFKLHKKLIKFSAPKLNFAAREKKQEFEKHVWQAYQSILGSRRKPSLFNVEVFLNMCLNLFIALAIENDFMMLLPRHHPRHKNLINCSPGGEQLFGSERALWEFISRSTFNIL